MYLLYRNIRTSLDMWEWGCGWRRRSWSGIISHTGVGGMQPRNCWWNLEHIADSVISSHNNILMSRVIVINKIYQVTFGGTYMHDQLYISYIYPDKIICCRFSWRLIRRCTKPTTAGIHCWCILGHRDSVLSVCITDKLVLAAIPFMKLKSPCLGSVSTLEDN